MTTAVHPVPLHEFFTGMYALYYNYDDPKRKEIPATVGNWMDDNIGKRDLDNLRFRLQSRSRHEGTKLCVMSMEFLSRW